jgi:ABC-type multidrug transport system ATPase subunit
VSKILEVKNLSKWYGNIKAIENVNFCIEKGQVVGLLGPNGSGKTTTLAILLGIKHPTAGTFSWFQQPDGKLENKRIGSLIEVPYFFPYLSLEKNLLLVTKIKGSGKSDIPRVLELVGLAGRRKSEYKTLSLGMKQRLALASAMLANPDVLVLDEPTNGLDPEGIAEVRNVIIDQSKRGKTIILASHILDEVEKVCTDVIILKAGNTITQGPVAHLLSDTPTVTLSAENMEQLQKALASFSRVKVLSAAADGITISLVEGIGTTEVNQWLMGQGIVLNKIDIQKKTLEQKFLNLVKEEHKITQ